EGHEDEHQRAQVVDLQADLHLGAGNRAREPDVADEPMEDALAESPLLEDLDEEIQGDDERSRDRAHDDVAAPFRKPPADQPHDDESREGKQQNEPSGPLVLENG